MYRQLDRVERVIKSDRCQEVNLAILERDLKNYLKNYVSFYDMSLTATPHDKGVVLTIVVNAQSFVHCNLIS